MLVLALPAVGLGISGRFVQIFPVFPVMVIDPVVPNNLAAIVEQFSVLKLFFGKVLDAAKSLL